LVCGTLSQAQTRLVVRHLLHGCETCRSAVAPQAQALLGGANRTPLDLETESGYDRAMERALAAAVQHGRHLKRETTKVREAVDRLAKDGVAGFQHFPMRLWGLAGYQALLERSWALRHDDPPQMVDLARLATLSASRLSVARYGARRIKDFECRANIELANAYRVANRLDEAQATLDRAAELFVASNEDRLLFARLSHVQANLHGDRRQFEAAFEALDTARRLYKKEGAEHLAARALITKGVYAGYANDPELAISLLSEGLVSFEPEQDRELARAAVYNIAWFSIDFGRLREARRLIWQHRNLFEGAGRQELLRLRWLEGRIHTGLEEFERAERAFAEVRQGFLEASVPYTAAIAALDLASVWMHQGKEDEARTIVLEATQVFLDLRIGREAMAAVLLLRTTFEFRMATGALLAEVAQFMRRVEQEPSLAFTTPR
jgi:tetratricopeptide (TPR) repeat protein